MIDAVPIPLHERRRAQVWTHAGFVTVTHGGRPVAFVRFPWKENRVRYRDGGEAEPGDLTEEELSALHGRCHIRGADGRLLCSLTEVQG